LKSNKPSINETLWKGLMSLSHNLLAPNCVNCSFGASNRAVFKDVLFGLKAAMPVRDLG